MIVEWKRLCMVEEMSAGWQQWDNWINGGTGVKYDWRDDMDKVLINTRKQLVTEYVNGSDEVKSGIDRWRSEYPKFPSMNEMIEHFGVEE